MEVNKIIWGKCEEVLRDYPDNCIDTIITDPPYGLKFMGKKWDYNVPSVETWKECLRVLKPGGTALIFAGSRTQHRMAVNVEDAGFILKDCIMYLYGSGFPKATDIGKQLDNGKRKVIGTYKTGYSKSQLESGYRPKEYECKITDSKPITPEAILWNGWKSHGLKPAYEPILVAMKSNEGSYANNALKYGVAGLNIDGGRIGTEEMTESRMTQSKGGVLNANGRDVEHGNWKQKLNDNPAKHIGRFPANIILDEESARLLDEQSGVLKSGNLNPGHKRGDGTGNSFMGGGGIIKGKYGGDTGGASRFFYCAKASKAERNKGCEGLEERDAYNLGHKDNPGRKAPKKSLPRANFHPCVKPLALMKYLVTLTKMPNPDQVYLDPFGGTGTTGMACKELGRKYIIIDSEMEYVVIARRRIIAIPETLF